MEGWREVTAKDGKGGKSYYWNVRTGQTSWQRPHSMSSVSGESGAAGSVGRYADDLSASAGQPAAARRAPPPVPGKGPATAPPVAGAATAGGLGTMGEMRSTLPATAGAATTAGAAGAGAAAGGAGAGRPYISSEPAVRQRVPPPVAPKPAAARPKSGRAGKIGRVASRLLSGLGRSVSKAIPIARRSTLGSGAAAAKSRRKQPNGAGAAAGGAGGASGGGGGADISAPKGASIGAPFGVQHCVHTTYDSNRARYSGLPEAWKNSESTRQFGVTLAGCPKVAVRGYAERIPALLELFKGNLLRMGGLRSEGIFRIAPAHAEFERVRAAVDRGETAPATHDVNVFARLIKVWFRELRPPLLNCVARDAVVRLADLDAGDAGAARAAFARVPEPNRSVLFWLLDLLLSVAAHVAHNKMTCKNLAIVLTPNLYVVDTGPGCNPMEALVMSKKSGDMVEKLLLARRLCKQGGGDGVGGGGGAAATTSGLGRAPGALSRT